MRRALAVLVLVAAALLTAACAGLGEDSAADLTPAADRSEAPAFSVPALDGDGRVSLAAHRGRPVVLNFWASWCEPCRKEMPELVRFAGEHPGIDVVGLAVNDRPSDSRRFARQAGATFEMGIDRDADTAADYGVTGLPVTVAIDAQGRVATTVFGPVGPAELAGIAEGLGADESRGRFRVVREGAHLAGGRVSRSGVMATTRRGAAPGRARLPELLADRDVVPMRRVARVGPLS